ncbi:hypothetical protein Tsubulata_039807, partial [Turnera subulata]
MRPMAPATKLRRDDDPSSTVTTSINDLEDTLLTEILKRLPNAREAIACTLVSKNWCSPISAPYFGSRFIDYHHKPTEVMVVLVCGDQNQSFRVARITEFSSASKEITVEIPVFSWNGFMHWFTDNNMETVVYDPYNYPEKLLHLISNPSFGGSSRVLVNTGAECAAMIWELTDYDRPQWIMKHSVPLEQLFGGLRRRLFARDTALEWSGFGPLLINPNDNHIAYLEIKGSICLCNLKRKVVEPVKSAQLCATTFGYHGIHLIPPRTSKSSLFLSLILLHFFSSNGSKRLTIATPMNRYAQTQKKKKKKSMESHVERFLNKVSIACITIATITLLFLFLQTPKTCIPPHLHITKPHHRFPSSTCDPSLHRPHIPLAKRNHRLWSSKSWGSQVSSLATFFQNLQSWSLFHNRSRVLCVSAGAGHEVMALHKLGVGDVTGVELVDSLPLVKRADPNHLPFFDGVFDLAFTRHFDVALFPLRFVSEMERTVRRGGVCVLVVEECGGGAVDG